MVVVVVGGLARPDAAASTTAATHSYGRDAQLSAATPTPHDVRGILIRDILGAERQSASARESSSSVASPVLAAEDAGADAGDTVGSACGLSFAGSTRVLLASGAAIPISKLKPGDKVEATNVKTGRTQAETVSVVYLNHDKDLYDLKIRTGHRTAVIRTTSNHPFWDLTRHRWIKAGALRYGDKLRAPSGGTTAVVVRGWTPRHRDGWMWDLTVPGGNDHDFYIDTTIAAILVHNCDEPGMPSLHAHYPTQEDALNAALHDAGITDPDLAVTNNYDGGSQMLGPNGEPWQSIEGFDDSGEVQEIQLHNAHSFPDGGGFGPHYINPATGFHYFWGE